MEDNGNGMEIEVRCLTGESIRVFIEPDRCVQDLKLLVRQSFFPASSSNDFHLFLKGVKLKLQSRISNYSIGNDEFLVVAPFTKKDKQQKERTHTRTSQNSNPNLSVNKNLETELAESAWVELMQDLSSLHGTSNNEIMRETELKSVNFENENTHGRRTTSRKKMLNNGKEKGQLDTILNILQNSSDNALDERNIKKFIEFMDSSSCLSHPATGFCVMRETNDLGDSQSDLSREDGSLCHCPLWLKDIMQSFYFVNIYSACLQLWQKKITLNALEGPLALLNKSGFQPTVADIEHLSEVCPQVIRLIDSAIGDAKLDNALIILKISAEKRDHCEDDPTTAEKRLPRSKIINLIKKREALLKDILSRAVKLFLFSNGEEKFKYCSLEDLMSFLKKADTMAAEAEVERERKRYSAASCSGSYEGLCRDTNSLLPEEMMGHLKSNMGCRGQVVHIEEISARNAKYVEIPSQLSESVKCALNRLGITKLYSHQAESIQASLAGKNVIVATMTSSGKSLCYNLPVLEVLSSNPLACALYLFPTKALAQDQRRAICAMAHGLDDSLNIGIYDGDTIREDRLWLRDNARLLITNPDMLHASILPCHGQFMRILSNLRFIVIDEAHAYKGTFGCHAALIFRRLRRLCSHLYGSDPSFVFTTATSANPREHAMELANLPTIELIENDGSPSGLKLFMLWNPPLCLKKVWKRTKTGMEANKSVGMVVGRSRFYIFYPF